MAKYPLLITGLLALVCGTAQAKCELGGDPSCFDTWGGDNSSRQVEELKQELELQRLGDSVRRQEEQRQESYRRSEPVIVNGPEGSRMYYPSSDGSFYQTYGR